MTTVTENISWWSRLKSSFIGFLLSFVIVIGALVLLAWNEHRTLKNFKGLKAVKRCNSPTRTLSTRR